MNQHIISRNNVKIHGKGSQPLLFAHGFGCDQNMWRYITPAFEDDFKIVLFDYVGAGKSDLRAYNSARYANLNGYAMDILEICSALDLQKTILVGHSVSSMVAVLVAIKEPKYFADLIMIGPSACYINEPDYVGGFERKDISDLLETMDRNYIGWANFMAPAIMKNSERPELANELAESFCSTDPIIARRFAEATFFSDNREDLPKVTIPSLIMQCSDDLIAPIEVGNYIKAHLPQSTFKLLRATGHCPHLSHPDETIVVMKEYLAGKGKLPR
jgi:sigma-B regulation protein RsbQ